MANEGELLTTTEAAARLGLTPSRIRHHILDGRLPAQKRGRDLWVRESDLARIAGLRRGPRPKARPSAE